MIRALCMIKNECMGWADRATRYFKLREMGEMIQWD